MRTITKIRLGEGDYRIIYCYDAKTVCYTERQSGRDYSRHVTKRAEVKIIIALIAFVLLVIVACFVFVYSGVYNIGATKPHNKFTYWMLNTIMEKSVKHHAKGIKSPTLSDNSLIQNGFSHYNEMCVGCHGKPGLSADELDNGFNPEPPDLVEEIKEGEWSAEELFWITKNGIKMSAMPSFEHNHSDEEIWAIVAFLERLPNISPEEYKAMELAADGEQHEHTHSH